jgi:ribose-phosphate pyrophosphokinase
VAQQGDFPFYVARKQRHDDQHVSISLPEMPLEQQHVILVDDIISSGHTLAETTRLLFQAGVQQVDALCTHALFDKTAAQLLKDAGIGSVWSSDSVNHPSNRVQLAPLFAEAISQIAME